MGATHGKVGAHRVNRRSEPNYRILLENQSGCSTPMSSSSSGIQSPIYSSFSPDAMCSRPLPSARVSAPIQDLVSYRRQSSLSALSQHSVRALSPPPSRASSPRTTTFQTPSSGATKHRRRPGGPHRSRTTSEPLYTTAIPSASVSTLTSSDGALSASPTLLTIRQTLYAAMAEVLSAYPSLRILLKQDPARAFSTTIALALLSISLSSLSLGDTAVSSFLGSDLSSEDILGCCPGPEEGSEYQSVIEELREVGQQGHELDEEDDQRAAAYIARGKDPPDRRLHRVRWILERGIGYVGENGKVRGEGLLAGREFGKTMLFASKIHQLAKRVVKIKSLFEHRAGEEILTVLVLQELAKVKE